MSRRLAPVVMLLLAALALSLTASASAANAPFDPDNATDPIDNLTGADPPETPPGPNASRSDEARNNTGGLLPSVVPDGVLGDGQFSVMESLGIQSRIWAFQGAWSRRTSSALAAVFGVEPRSAMNSLERLISIHNETILRYANAHLSDGVKPHVNVINLTLTGEDKTVSRYVVLVVDDTGDFRRIRVGRSLARDVDRYVELDSGQYLVRYAYGDLDTVDSLTYQVDYAVEIDGWAVDEVAADFESFLEFAADETVPTEEWLTTHTAKYGDAINVTYVGDE